MGNTHRVGATYASGWFIAPLVIGLALMALAVFEREVGVALFIMFGIPALLVAVGAGIHTHLNSRFLQVEEAGFVFTDRRGELRLKDDDVKALTFQMERKYNQGILSSVVYHVKLWADARPEPLRVEYSAPLEGLDEVEKWFERLRLRLLERTRAEVQAGRTVEGEGWNLGRMELQLVSETSMSTLRLQDVASAALFDDKVRVWKVGEELPVAEFSLSKRNAWLLLALLPELLPKRPEEDAPPAGGGLGKALFERTQRQALHSVLQLASIVLVFGGLGACIAYVTGHSELLAGISVLWAPPAIVLGLVLGRFAFDRKLMTYTFRCHEWGVSETKWNRERRMPYSEMDAFAYAATRVFVNGVYTHTTVSLAFGRPVASGRESMTYGTSSGEADQGLDLLRDHISGVIARRMGSELAAGKQVAWLSDLSFGQEGLQYVPSGLFGKKPPVIIPYSSISSHGIDRGVYRLWQSGNDKPVLEEQSSQANFFPGYVLMGRILTPPAESSGEQGGGGAPADAAQAQPSAN